MRRVCAWCDKELTSTAGPLTSDVVSHGICDACATKVLAGSRATARAFLEGLREPVFLVDGNARVHAANSRARALVGKDSREVEDQLAGDVIECANASQPGGCGATEHCKACTIRQSVTETIATGRPVRGLPAFQDIRTERGVQRKRFLVSSERAGTFVLLSIEEDVAANLVNET